jgi:hypothetical protein
MKKSELRNIIREEVLAEITQGQIQKIAYEIADSGFLKVTGKGVDHFKHDYVTLKSSKPEASWKALRQSGIEKFLPKRIIMKGPTSLANGKGTTLEFFKDGTLRVVGIPLSVLNSIGIK